jgi:NPCBM/NEW2 domain
MSHARLVRPLTEGAHALSSLPMLAFRNESGPVERDQSNGGGNPGDGQRITIAGAEHDDGLGVSTPSSIDIYLGRRARLFEAHVGVDDETPGTRARARVLGDGIELASLTVEAGRPATVLDVDVRGVRVLTLTTDAPTTDARTTDALTTEPAAVPLADHIDSTAHVDWASARIHVTPEDMHTTPGPGHD